MPSRTIEFADLADEYQRLPARDIAAVRLAIKRTLAIDAQRWIQWSIRGGGLAAPPRRTDPGKPRAPKKRKSMIRSLLKKLKLKLRGKKPPPLRNLKPKDPCARRPAPAYPVPIDTGDYANSWRYELTDDGGIFYSSPNPAIKGGVIEAGRRPAPIPIGPLTDWVRRKLGCKDPAKAKGIAIAISKRAAKSRREGLHVLERASPKIDAALQANIVTALRAASMGKKP